MYGNHLQIHSVERTELGWRDRSSLATVIVGCRTHWLPSCACCPLWNSRIFEQLEWRVSFWLSPSQFRINSTCPV